jgi:cell division initiation protein
MLNIDEATTTTTETPATPKPAGDSGRRLPGAERHASITPLDMRQAKFGAAMRGYDKAEVTAFLEQAAADYEHALRENDRLKQQIATLDAAMAQYRDLEGSLKTTLVSAQKVADDMRQNAQQESARIVREAESRAELIAQKALTRVEDIQREIDGLRLKRREVQTNMEACISTLHSTIQFIREQEQRESGRGFAA